MSNLHRIVWIDARIRSAKYPNCRMIAEEFEISPRQASRDVEYMRYSMGAPIEYSAEKNGYYYSDTAFVLPALFISNDEKRALSFLAYQYRNLGDGQAAKLAELFSRLTGDDDSRSSGMERIPVLNVRHSELKVFEQLKAAAETRRKVRMQYTNAEGETSSRVFCPYKLFAKGRQSYIAGYCELRNEIRVFRLDRITCLEPTDSGFTVSPLFNANEFGDNVPFQFKDPYECVVRFRKAVDENAFKLPVCLMEDCTYRIKFRSSEEVLAVLLSYPGEFTVVSPNWLKTRLGERLKVIFGNNFA